MTIGVDWTPTSFFEGRMANYPDRETVFDKAIAEHLDVIRSVQEQIDVLESIARVMAEALHRGGQILWCGNGGSAADSQHLAAEIVGRFRRERRGLPSIALTTDTSILTAIANDYGYEAVFSRQIEALGRAGDVLVGISTSGNSHNVIAALEIAKVQGLATVAFTGAGGGRMGALADHLFAVDSRDTARVQEAHILAGHMICDWVEMDWIASQDASHAVPTSDVDDDSMEARAGVVSQKFIA
jgi:D-sedoheptulose 7-phosphate isomerase